MEALYAYVFLLGRNEALLHLSSDVAKLEKVHRVIAMMKDVKCLSFWRKLHEEYNEVAKVSHCFI